MPTHAYNFEYSFRELKPLPHSMSISKAGLRSHVGAGMWRFSECQHPAKLAPQQTTSEGENPRKAISWKTQLETEILSKQICKETRQAGHGPGPDEPKETSFGTRETQGSATGTK